MIGRRELLKTAVISAAVGRALRAAAGVRFGCQTNAWAIDPKDFGNVLAVLRKIRDYGYEGFETGFANVHGQFERTGEARKEIEATGIRFFGVHIFLTQYDAETCVAPADLYERVGRGGSKLGAERLILSGVPPKDEAGRKRKAEALNQAGAFAAGLGMKLAYHNHGPEVTRNAAELDFLIKETNPDKVWFLLDAGHAFEAGADPVALVQRYHQRLTGMHLRDFKNGEQVPLGMGDFPLTAVAQAVRETGWNGWVLNEEERLTSKPGDGAVKPAHEALFRAFGRTV